ncbi:hypothetical protein SAMN03159488_03263 [Pseudomonas sp. NFIX10]|nr:hypothetical protein SAMN03159488_03263 [Pseudomonas sp. NFIX10]SFF03220.1 hypothetical protein SAMN03159367_02852 [Pseudomonas sp. NFACC06-1]
MTSSRASSLPQEAAFQCGSELARDGVLTNNPYQNERIIRPNVSMAFSEDSVQGLP